MAEDDIQFVESKPLINGFAEIPDLPTSGDDVKASDLEAAGAELEAYETIQKGTDGPEGEVDAPVEGVEGAEPAEKDGEVEKDEEPKNAYEAVAEGAAGNADAEEDAPKANAYEIIAQG